MIVPHIIPVAACIENGIYRVDGRNFGFAVWTGIWFVGEREKAGRVYLTTEDHWDDHGTVKPLEHIGSLLKPEDTATVLRLLEGSPRVRY